MDNNIIEVKNNPVALRDFYEGLVQIAKLLSHDISNKGWLFVIDPRISDTTLNGEFLSFKNALRPEIANRLNLVIFHHGKSIPIKDGNELDPQLVRQILSEAPRGYPILPSAEKRDEVFLALLHQWVTGQGPMTARFLEEVVGCNYRTVFSAVDMLGASIERLPDRRFSLKYFPEHEWGRFLAVARKVRATLFFADASDQPRSTDSLLRRFLALKRSDVAVGGVLGAKRYYADLDLVGNPRLDLCVHCPGSFADIAFVQDLDPALERTSDQQRPARLAVHFIRRKETFFDPENDGSLWADPVESLIHLYQARLDEQARAFQEFLMMRGRELNG
jgi:hypothetical protein